MNDSNENSTLAPEYFEAVYDANDDPWNFAASEYEAAKYDATLAALPKTIYKSAFEVGCSIGILTAKLAARCESLLAVDVSEKAVRQAKNRCRNLPNVELRLMQIPAEFPARKFDLILISEVGYYLSVADWKKTFKKIIESLELSGNVCLVHWTPTVHDYPQTGDAVHDLFAEWSLDKLKLINSQRAEKYRLDVWEKI